MTKFDCTASWITVLVFIIICSYSLASQGNATFQLQPIPKSMEQLQRENFLIGIANVGVRLANGTQCGKELEHFLKDISSHELWTLKVIDSFGSVPKTFTWGHFYWFAPKELCEDLNSPFNISYTNQSLKGKLLNIPSPVPVRYSMVYFRFATPYYVNVKPPFENLIHLGLCLPQSCHAADILKFSDFYFKNKTFEMQQNYEIEMNAIHIKMPEFKWSFFEQTGSVIFFSFAVILIVTCIIAELLHKLKRNHMHQQESDLKSNAIPDMATTTVTVSQTKTTKFEDYIQCYCLSENYSRLLRLEKSDSYLSVLAGLRTIICIWVTFFHVSYYSLYTLRNTAVVFAKLENFALQPLIQACFYVDIFFVISAFLLVFNFLSNENYMKKIRDNSCFANLVLFLRAILHRYMRLTPVLIVTMLLSDMVFDFLNMFSPFHLDIHSGIYCKQNWWYNLLYVQNFLNMNDICCSWTWYLGCEMQYFIIFTALLFVYAKNETLAKIVFILFASCCLLTSFLCSYYNNTTFKIDDVFSTLDQLYVKPWVRIAPYIGGALVGWLLHRHKDQQHTKPERSLWETAFWLGFAALCFVTTFMTYWRSTPTWLVATIMSFGKFLFALWVGGAIVLCAWNRGGIFDALLSARPFLFLNKLSFSIYLIAPPIIFAMFGLRMEPTSFTEAGTGGDFLSGTLLSIVAAFLIVLLVELPMQRVTNKYIRKV